MTLGSRCKSKCICSAAHYSQSCLFHLNSSLKVASHAASEVWPSTKLASRRFENAASITCCKPIAESEQLLTAIKLLANVLRASDEFNRACRASLKACSLHARIVMPNAAYNYVSSARIRAASFNMLASNPTKLWLRTCLHLIY